MATMTSIKITLKRFTIDGVRQAKAKLKNNNLINFAF